MTELEKAVEEILLKFEQYTDCDEYHVHSLDPEMPENYDGPNDHKDTDSEWALRSILALIQDEVRKELKLLKTKKVKGVDLVELKWIDKRIKDLSEGKE